MSQQLSMELAVSGSRFLPMEAIPVRVTIRNGGPVAVELPSEHAGDPFEYLITRLDGAAPPETLSEARFAREREGSGVPRVVPPKLTSLASGGERAYQVNVTALATHPFRPGGYEVTVALSVAQTALSARGRFEIVRPAVIMLAGNADVPVGYNGTAFADRSNGTARILQREGPIGRPDLAPFVAIGEAGAVTSLGITRAVAPEQRNWRWTGWLEDTAFHARLRWGRRTSGTAGPIDVGAASLVPHGLHAADGTATFYAIGTDARSPRLARITVPPRGDTRIEPIALDWPRLDRVLPWVARNEDEFAGATLALLAEQDGSVRIAAVDWTGAGAVAGRATLPGSLLAASVSPDGAADPVIDVLVGRDAEIARHRIPLLGLSGEPTTVPLPALPADLADPAWAIGTTTSGDPVVLLTAGPDLWVSSDEGWRSLPRATGPVSSPRLVSTTGRDLWAIWVDPELGAQYRRVR